LRCGKATPTGNAKRKEGFFPDTFTPWRCSPMYRKLSPSRARTPGRSRPHFQRPTLERLKDRVAPAVATRFDARFSANVTRKIAVIASTLETATTFNNPGRNQEHVRRGRTSRRTSARSATPAGRRSPTGRPAQQSTSLGVPHSDLKKPWFSA